MTDEELTRESRPVDAGGSRVKALLLVLVSAALVVAGATWYLGFRPGTESQAPSGNEGTEQPLYQQSATYTCLGCAVELHVTKTTRRKGDAQHVDEEQRPTPLSGRLGGDALVSKCTHDWYLLGEHTNLQGVAGRERAHNRSAIDIFESTDAGAAALTAFADATGRDPKQVWRTLGLWLTHSNPRVESRFAGFERDDPALQTKLRAWLDDNFSVLERAQHGRGRGHTKALNDSYRSEKPD